MICRQSNSPFASIAAAYPASRRALNWLLVAILVWLSATLLLAGPGVAILVTVNPTESDAPVENERTAVDASSHSSHLRRTGARQLVHRRALWMSASALLTLPPPVFQAPRRAAALPIPDAQFGAGIPLRC